MISLEKLKFLTPLQKLPKSVGELGKLIVAKGFEKLTKVQKIAPSGHQSWVTGNNLIKHSVTSSLLRIITLFAKKLLRL